MTANKQSGRFKWLVVVLLLGGAGVGGWVYFKSPKDAPVDFKTTVVARGEITQSVTANGQITPVKSVLVGSEVSGKINKINVDFNSIVKEGDIIAEIDPSTIQQNVMQAEAEVANAQASLELAQISWRRAGDLRKADLIPQADADNAVAVLHQSEAVVKMRQASLQKAKVDLSKTTIYAPISGVVIVRNVDVGQTVAASFSTPTLFNIANDLAKMQIDAMVSEADVGGVEEGQGVTFTVDAFPQRKFRGSVKQVRFAPTTNQNVVNYTTVVEVNNADLKLRPGMTASATILIAEHKDVLRIPNAALRFRPPTGAAIQGGTNAPVAEKGKVELATSGPFAGMPIPPWQSKGERRRPTDEERAAYEASLTPEQKQKYQEIIAAMRARFAQGEGGGSGGSGSGDRVRRAEPTGPRTQTIYLLAKEASATGPEKILLKPVTVKVGISDGANTEVIEGLTEGDVVVVGTVSSAASGAAPANPFGSPFGGPGRR